MKFSHVEEENKDSGVLNSHVYLQPQTGKRIEVKVPETRFKIDLFFHLSTQTFL